MFTNNSQYQSMKGKKICQLRNRIDRIYLQKISNPSRPAAQGREVSGAVSFWTQLLRIGRGGSCDAKNSNVHETYHIVRHWVPKPIQRKTSSVLVSTSYAWYLTNPFQQEYVKVINQREQEKRDARIKARALKVGLRTLFR